MQDIIKRMMQQWNCRQHRDKRRKKENKIHDLKHPICQLFQQLPDLLIATIKNLTISDLETLGKNALQNKLKQFTNYLEDGKSDEIIALWKIESMS